MLGRSLSLLALAVAFTLTGSESWAQPAAHPPRPVLDGDTQFPVEPATSAAFATEAPPEVASPPAPATSAPASQPAPVSSAPASPPAAVSPVPVSPPVAAQPLGARPKPEFGALPLAGGDSDYGLGFGGFASYALPDPKNPPFVWGLELGGFITFRSINGENVNPYQDIYLLGRHLQLLKGRMRVESRLSWTREETLNYFGIGNASVAPTKSQTLDGFRYARTHPEFYARVRYNVVGPWNIELGQYYAHNALDIAADARLAADYAAPPPGFASSFKTAEPHDVARTEASIMWDTRDNELAPTRGQFHDLRYRFSPQIGERLPYGYQQVSLNSRFFQALGTKNVILAARLVGDVLLGDPPFYEMSRYDETNAIGGVKGVRGVLAQRYYGKARVFGNLELRFRVFDFRLFKKTYTVGAVSFFDGGRVWSDLTPTRALDGTGIGLKYGVGGGLRLMQGTTFVVRGDIAWSPDARPIGAYVTAGHMF